MDVLFPSGDIATRQRDVILVSTGLMLLIIVPVLLLTIVFAWWYRDSNIDARHDPDWHHSTQLEVVIWAAPLLIIVALGALTWISTHVLDPFRPLRWVAADKPVPPGTKPLTVEVVALDWKWLFIYPDQGVASLNEMAAPVNLPITFRITSASVMNTFYVPAMAGMIYAMPGMESQLHAVMNEPGDFTGISAHYSGAGFSDMHFRFRSLSNDDFDKWVASVKGAKGGLDRREFMNLQQPSEREPVRHYRSVEAGLYEAIVTLCVDPAKTCTSTMPRMESRRGGNPRSEAALADGGRRDTLGKKPIAQICTTADATGVAAAQGPPVQAIN